MEAVCPKCGSVRLSRKGDHFQCPECGETIRPAQAAADPPDRAKAYLEPLYHELAHQTRILAGIGVAVWFLLLLTVLSLIVQVISCFASFDAASYR